jgi:tetraacyldisaccharide 4'-kinase
VGFGYQGNPRSVLKGISFTVNPGETVALVGRSGSGKSTLMSLIPRFYAPSTGEILVDGHPIDSFRLDNLREHIAIVSQQVTLFNDTVMRNIGYGTLQGASRNAIKNAAEKAYAWQFIEDLDSGLETIVGDDGVLLSGGQRQRLAIARAFLKDAPILILDEATSSLDTESERYIQSALEAVVQGRTTFIIAHRLSTIEKADRIFVIEEGEIVEEGSHIELLAKRGAYSQLHVKDEIGESTPTEAKPITVGVQPETKKHNIRGLDSRFIVDAWYNDTLWVKALVPLAYLYRILAFLRRSWLTKRAIWRSPVPLIIVGNISLGGTGKSPLVIGIVQHLKDLGLKPGVVSRGYGANSKYYPVEVTMTSLGSEVGDEPLMIYKRTGVPVFVDPDRVRAVKELISQHECDVVVSDDGLQHYTLGRDIEIAVVDGARGLGNGFCLPAGPLREPASRLKEVDLVVINGEDSLSRMGSAANYTVMQLKPLRLVSITSGRGEPADSLAGKTVHAVVGISHPERFFDTLKSLGILIIPHEFPDHHALTRDDVNFDDNTPVIMTEKDAVKLDLLGLREEQYWYLEVEACFDILKIDALLKKSGIEKIKHRTGG